MPRFSQQTSASWSATIRGALLAAKTVIWTPPHESRVLHVDVARQLQARRLLLEKPIVHTVAAIDTIIQQNSKNDWPKLSAKERLGLFAALMQFTMYLPTIRPYFRADYTDVAKLHSLIAKRGHTSPLSLDGQLKAALELSNTVPEALWLLLVTSRQFARWYDEESFLNMPAISKKQAKADMLTWSKSVTAFKKWSASSPQDSAGDTYYVWTHAIAKLLFGPMSSPLAIDAHLYKAALHMGTWLNHSIAHKVSPQSIASNHSIAARYGNAIGRQIIASVKKYHLSA